MTRLNPAIFGKVGVLYGGWNSEREISLMSGACVIEGLERAGVDVVPIDLREDTVFEQLENVGVDRFFNILHGQFGEDGCVQAVLDLLKVPYTGCGVLASALTMDKISTQRLLKGAGLPVADFEIITAETDPQQLAERLGLPLVIKPSIEGSSNGVTIVKEKSQIPEAYELACQYYPAVMAEAFIGGGEYAVSIVGDQVMPSICIEVTTRPFYDYVAKYFDDNTLYHCPSGLSEQEEAECQALACAAYDTTQCEGWGRVDLLRDKNGHFYILEINTTPGMTTHSLVPKAAKQLGMLFDEVVVKILETTLD